MLNPTLGCGLTQLAKQSCCFVKLDCLHKAQLPSCSKRFCVTIMGQPAKQSCCLVQLDCLYKFSALGDVQLRPCRWVASPRWRHVSWRCCSCCLMRCWRRHCCLLLLMSAGLHHLYLAIARLLSWGCQLVCGSTPKQHTPLPIAQIKVGTLPGLARQVDCGSPNLLALLIRPCIRPCDSTKSKGSPRRLCQLMPS